jgi:hypothetical protein
MVNKLDFFTLSDIKDHVWNFLFFHPRAQKEDVVLALILSIEMVEAAFYALEQDDVVGGRTYLMGKMSKYIK